jgi:hypothetical protein
VIVRSLSLALKPQYAISPCSKLDEKEEETAAAVVSYIILLEKFPFFLLAEKNGRHRARVASRQQRQSTYVDPTN